MVLTNQQAHLSTHLAVQIAWATTRPRPDASPRTPRHRVKADCVLHSCASASPVSSGDYEKDKQFLYHKDSTARRNCAFTYRFQPANKGLFAPCYFPTARDSCFSRPNRPLLSRSSPPMPQTLDLDFDFSFDHQR